MVIILTIQDILSLALQIRQTNCNSDLDCIKNDSDDRDEFRENSWCSFIQNLYGFLVMFVICILACILVLVLKAYWYA